MQCEDAVIGELLEIPPEERAEVGPSKQVDEEAFHAYPYPPDERSRDWLDRASSKLEEAARSWPAVFGVSRGAIRRKLVEAEDLIVLADQASIVVGFVSARHPLKLRRTGLTARYIEGTIVHRTRGEKGKFGGLMESLGKRADIEVLHTQNPKMAESLGRRSEVLFPTRDNALALGDELCADLRDLLDKIGRGDPFDATTGIVRGMYEHRLYSEWPMPGSNGAMSFENLDQEGAVLVVGFEEARVADKWLVSVAGSINSREEFK